MASQWADYLISAVRYNAAETHIDKVRAHPDKGESVGSGTETSRTRIVSLLEAGTTFATIVWNSATKSWNYGAEVAIIAVAGEKYIRTDPDNTKSDNLGQLPRF
ncbi:MAG: hypothetical protein QOG53_3512 [Frankiales bacterium]|nr:hypothetical protein [Frankiales bacterium]